MQVGFVPNRLIQENIILAHELVHKLKHQKGKQCLMALKIDMEKAYDRIEWNFLLEVLRCFGFSNTWIQLIRQCISTVSFSLLLNGSTLGLFRPHRGIRQEDPISPFLFILCSEVLSRLLISAEANNLISGLKISRQAPPISHLMFADDLTIFCKARSKDAEVIHHCLSTYAAW